MCTRYYVELSPELRPIIEEARRSSLAGRMTDKLGIKMKTEGEVRPSDMVPVIAPDKSGNRKAYPMIWGFFFPGIPRPVVNARSETAGEKRSFRESWERRRCIIPASWYYEWEHVQQGGRVVTGDKYAIQTPASHVTWLAGLYRIESSDKGIRYPSFTVLTREPSPDLYRIHDRMPVVLSEQMLDPWIFPGTSKKELKEIVAASLTELTAERC